MSAPPHLNPAAMQQMMQQPSPSPVPSSTPTPASVPMIQHAPLEVGVSLAPMQMVPPLLSGYLPSQPPPSAQDSMRQRPADISLLTTTLKDGGTQTMQVRKRVHATDGVRLGLRKKRAIAGASSSNLQSGLSCKELPEALDLNLPECGLVNQLLALEKRLDATIARKHVEMQHALHPQTQHPQVLRIFLWHEMTTPLTHDELMNGQTNHDKPEYDAWMLKIQGQILDASQNSNALLQSQPSCAAGGTRCLANYLSGLVIQIEGNSTITTPASVIAAAAASSSAAASAAIPANAVETIEWRKHSAVSLSDGFEIRRRRQPGVNEINMKINLFIDHSPARFRISPPLSQALSLPTHAPNPLPHAATTPQGTQAFPYLETQNGVLMAFWEYVKAKNLQDAVHPTVIKCDPTFVNLFGVSELPISSVLSFLQVHMSPASASDPVILPYTIRFSDASRISPSQVICYDILTYTPVVPNLQESYKEASTLSGLKTQPPPVHQTQQTQRHTEKLHELVMEIDRCNRRREFLLAFSEAPTQVIQLLLSHHARDQLLMMGPSGVDDELERRGEYYHAEWQVDACDRMMQEEANHAASAQATSQSMFDESDE